MDVVRLAFIVVLAAAPGTLACSFGFSEINGECLEFHPEVLLSWQDSVYFCQNETDATLASMKDADTLRGVYTYIKTYGLIGSFWLGASDIELEGDWSWLDGTRVDRGTPYWAIHSGLFGWTHEPSGGTEQNCLALDEARLFYFNDAECSSLLHPICME
ncbi:CD209 antigen-like protein C [Penaeus japonicus]|uniref:CD209 antigen-like protein C n=1 Tax=Penaeus japonicus TaxID=27405 RepID=UPI001C70FE1B|nr:CD209 antigen-like protein C [Penaeus japonicus]XP_042871089.1 CD209 antigen-like protein C [Penaeus japonicus]